MTEDRQRPADERPVSLAGLDPEEALRALLKVDPESEPVDEAREDGPARPQEGRLRRPSA